jgi:ABC-type bacteriocin/lantibiotic exporter with double-glycine peptidase domain
MPFCFYPIYLKDLTAAYDEDETQITSLIYYGCITILMLILMFILDSYQFKSAFIKQSLDEEKQEEETGSESLLEKEKLAIECKNVSKIMKGAKEPIISNITFEVKKGSVMGLLGPSGAGKSTLFSLLAMLEARDTGHIVLDSVRLDKGSYREAQRSLDVGIVFQEDVLWANKTVDENLRLVGRFKGVKEEEL